MKWIRAVQYPYSATRTNGAGVVLGSSFYLYGGYDGKVRLGDLLRIDLTTYNLTRINGSGTTPGGVWDHCIAALSDTQFILYGGRQADDSTGIVNNVHIYDTRTDTWTDVTPNNSTSSSPAPSARFATGCTVLNGSFYSFGGSDGTLLNELWVLEPRNWTWRSLSPSSALPGNVPSPRSFTRLVTLGKYLVTYGGITAMNPITISTDSLLYFYNTQTGE
ncbi:hypothetical protein HK104_006616 [Borealophlyctis nickersoniae]|nr:hypothetical protein HK104_006616 [Borealophlyctis nickersoniae]